SLEVTFRLKVRVRALRDVDAELSGTKLRAGTRVEATLEDKIFSHTDSELDLIDLRRRARALGGRFPLKASKSEYLVSNNPSLLAADDILLSPGTTGDVPVKISFDYDKRIGNRELLESDPSLVFGDNTLSSNAQYNE